MTLMLSLPAWRRFPRQRASALAAACLLWAATAHAHGGDDHGAAPAVSTAAPATQRSVVAMTPLLEAVARVSMADVVRAGTAVPVTVLLSEYATNAPVEGASVDADINDGSVNSTVALVALARPGHYRLPLTLQQNATLSITLTVTAGELVDVVALPPLRIGAAAGDEVAPEAHDHDAGVDGSRVVIGVLALLLVLSLVLLWRSRRRVPAAPALWWIVVWAAGSAQAHGGDDHGEKKPQAARVTTSTVAFPKEQQFLLGVRTAVVQEAALRDRLTVPGTIALPPERHAAIVVPQSGRLFPPGGAAGGAFPQLGAAVKRGQVLGVVEAVLSPGERASFASTAAEAQAQVTVARTRLQQAQAQQARLESVAFVASQGERERAALAVAEAEGEVAAALSRLSAFSTSGGAARFELVSPLAGVVADVDVSPGEVLEQGARAFLVVDPRTLTVEAQVAESELSWLQTARQIAAPEHEHEHEHDHDEHEGDDEHQHVDGGAHADVASPMLLRSPGFALPAKSGGPVTADVTVDAWPGRTFAATLMAQGQVVDPKTRTVKVVFHVDNADDALKIGMFARVHLRGAARQERVAVDRSAVLDREGRALVFVHTAPESFEPREVVLGSSSFVDGRAVVEVRAGLAAGERVVVQGAYSLLQAQGR